MKDKSYALSIRFEGDLDIPETIIFLEKFVIDHLKISFKELNYSILDKSGFYYKLKSKSIRLTPKNIAKIKSLIDNKTENIEITFELFTLQDGKSFKAIDIMISALYPRNSIINAINLIINSRIEPNVTWFELIQLIIDFINVKCKVVYCFLFLIDNEFMPSFYLEGIGKYGMSEQISQKLNLWSSNKDICDKKVWDIFWGNVLLRDNLSSAVLNELRKIVGNENIKTLNHGLIWFNLNSNLLDFEIDNPTLKMRQLYQLFKAHNLIIG